MDSTLDCAGYRSESRKACAPDQGQDCFWNSAPEELIARILASLPCSNIFLAQGVCRRWRSIIWSPLFISLCKQWPCARKPWLLEFQQQMYSQAWAFDLDGWQWFHLNFSFLPANAIVLASSGGLVCLGKLSTEGYNLFICNPLTKKWRQLPSIPVYAGVVLLDVDHESNTYTVAALVLRGQPSISRPSGAVYTYDSKTGVWRETIGMPQELHVRNIWDASLCGSLLCCLTTCQRTEVFDIAQAEWTQNAPFARLPNDAGLHAYIFNQAGRWGVVLPHRGPKGKSVYWYDPSAMRWSSASRATSIVCAGRFASLYSSAAHRRMEVYSLHGEGHRCYSTTSGSISILPKSPISRQKVQGRDILIRAIWYEPHLKATP